MKEYNRDLEILKAYTVDFVAFSYYASCITSAKLVDGAEIAGNVFKSLRTPHLKAHIMAKNYKIKNSPIWRVFLL